MTWRIPVTLLMLAGVLALGVAWPRLRQPMPLGRFALEAFAMSAGVIAIAAVLWALYWWIEQRW